MAANVVLETEAPKVFSWISGTRQGCLLSWLSCSIKLEVIDETVKQEKERMEGVHIRRLLTDYALETPNTPNSEIIGTNK